MGNINCPLNVQMSNSYHRLETIDCSHMSLLFWVVISIILALKLWKGIPIVQSLCEKHMVWHKQGPSVINSLFYFTICGYCFCGKQNESSFAAVHSLLLNLISNIMGG